MTQSKLEMPSFMSAAEAARAINVTPRSIRRWIAEGALEARRLGPGRVAHYRIPVESLDRFLRTTTPDNFERISDEC